MQISLASRSSQLNKSLVTHVLRSNNESSKEDNFTGKIDELHLSYGSLDFFG